MGVLDGSGYRRSGGESFGVEFGASNCSQWDVATRLFPNDFTHYLL